MQDDKEPGAGWVFKPGSDEPSSGYTPDPNDSSEDSLSPNKKRTENSTGGPLVSWSASEYISNPKNITWFGALGIGTAILSIFVYFVTRDLLSTVVIVIIGVITGIFAARQPQTLEYHVDSKGIHIGPKSYPYGVFRSYSVAHDGAFSYISLLPLKRFMPQMTIHYAPEDEEKIVETLGDYLPYEQHKQDIVDSITRRVRF